MLKGYLYRPFQNRNLGGITIKFNVYCTQYKIHSAFTLNREICGYSESLKRKPELTQHRHTEIGNTFETLNFRRNSSLFESKYRNATLLNPDFLVGALILH